MGEMLRINGFQEALTRIHEMGGDVDEAARTVLQRQANRVTRDLKQGIAKHRYTGKTEEALKERPMVISVNGRHFVEIGFDLPEGLPARYINKGTPTNRPKDPFIDRALNKTRIKKEQEQFFEELMR